MTRPKNFGLFQQVIFYSLSVSLVLCPTISYAQVTPQNNIVIDQSAHVGGQDPNFDRSQNGTDVLNIVAPTSGGVSHNRFTEYNVNEQGLIINNLSFQNGVGQAQSELGGTVAYNKNLGLGDAARVILNEVTSNSTSSLKGYTEIFGAKAALIISNPNGITCEGCGFLNTSKLSLITGIPNMENGDIKDFSMNTSGIIEIFGTGGYNIGLHVDGSPAQIVSNSVKIAGLILLDDDQQLEIMTGNDKFDYKNSSISSDNTHSVGVAVDSSALGGIYAGRIKIHATQKGFGVNTDGGLVASMDNVEITADGDIVYKNIAAQNNINITSQSGKITAKVNLDTSYNQGKSEGVSVINTASNITSNEGKINVTGGEGDLNIKGSSLSAKDDINLTTSDSGNINISSSVDTTKMNSSDESYSFSTSFDLVTGGIYIPTIGTTGSESKYNETSGNNSTLTSQEGSININSADDINIKGANIKAENDVNLTAENGDINISSTQDTLFSNDKYNSYQIGGTTGFGVGKDKVEKITNNLTTIESNSGDVNVNTNDLTLTEVNKDNLNLSEVKGNITENRLYEKDEHDWYDMSAQINLPITISTGWNGFGEQFANLFQSGADSAGLGDVYGKSVAWSDSIIKPMQPQTESQAIINVGDWKGALLNTTLRYKDNKGYDFSASPASIIAPSIIIKDIYEIYVADKGAKMSWKSGEKAVYKKEGDAYSSLDINANNIGLANTTNDPAKIGTEVNLTGLKYIFSINEGSLMSDFANYVMRLNSMSIGHDKSTNDGLMSNTPLLETSIIPAIPVTYIGLIFGGTLNDTGTPLYMKDITPIDWDDAEKLKGQTLIPNKDQYLLLQQLQDKYLNK